MQVRSTNNESRVNIQKFTGKIVNYIRRSLLVIRYSSARGFTLIELLVVIAIIGILVSIGVVGWVSVAQRGRDTTRKSDLVRIKQVLQQYYSDFRTYPQYDSSPGRIFVASWQLAPTGTTCQHFGAGSVDFGLPTKYIANIPQDPKDTTDYKSLEANCGAITDNQGGKYLYLTSSDATAPDKSPTKFGLMATLERPLDDLLVGGENPLLIGTTYLGPWYATRDYYETQPYITANYLVDSRNQ